MYAGRRQRLSVDMYKHQDQAASETGRGRDLQVGATDKEPL
jgi:hypothetical protein